LIPFQSINRIPFISVFIILHYFPFKLKFLIKCDYFFICFQFLVLIQSMEQVDSDFITWIICKYEIDYFFQYFVIVLDIQTCQMHDVHPSNWKTLFIPKYHSYSLLISDVVYIPWHLTLFVLFSDHCQYKHILLIIDSTNHVILLTHECFLLSYWKIL